MANPRIDIDITADSSGARREFDKAGDGFGKFKDGVDKAAKGATVAAGGILAIGVVALDAAKDAERAATTVDRVFGAAADSVDTFASHAADTVGVSAREYESLAASLGVAMTGIGLDVDTAASKTNDLLTVAGDMALALGVDVPAATDALGAAMRGEMDALQNFGIAVSDADVQAGLAAKGITDPATGLAPAIGSAQYQQELLNQILEKSGAVYGGYRAETDTTAERQQNLTAKWDDAVTKLGTALIPVLDTGADKLEDVVTWIDKNSDAIVAWLPYVGGAIAAVWALNWALAANPIVLWTTLIVIAIGAIIIFRDQITSFINGALQNLENALGSSDWWGTQLQEALGALGLAGADFEETINNISDALSGLWGWFQRQWTLTLPSVPLAPAAAGFGAAPAGFTVAPFTVAPAAGLMAARAGFDVAGVVASAGAAAAPINITVNGAVDPDATARQIEQLLRRRGRRTGSVIPA